jgi:membrane-bound serine protease (ClpP class)
MRDFWRPFLCVLLTVSALLAPAAAQESAEPASGESTGGPGRPTVVVAELRGMVFSISARLLVEAIERAEEIEADLVLFELDTPGGLVTSTETIVKAMLNAEVPVAVFVEPRAAHAASAGFFILMAGDVAAMAPSTRTGAASPVGTGTEDDKEAVAWQKAAQDLAALMRGTARLRGRNWEEAEKAVSEARAWDSQEALELGLIDLIADDRGELLELLDGRELRAEEGEAPRVLRTAGAEIVTVTLDWKERIQKVLFHPSMMLILVGLGVVGLYIEFQNPGLILPGVVGAICLAIFLFGSQLLPVNFFGVVLLALAGILLILEIKVTSYGMLTLAGLSCLFFGAWILFPRDIPALAIPLEVFLPVILTVAAIMVAVLWLVIRAQGEPVTTGVEGMVGETGEAATDLEPGGKVFVRGEYWEARSRAPISRGARIRVLAVQDMMLEVAPEPEDPR